MTPNEIKQMRLSLDMTQEEFAKFLDTTTTNISRWERGKASPNRKSSRLLLSVKMSINDAGKKGE